MKQIYYDRILPYRGDDERLQKSFADIYVEAFNDPDGAYAEKNTTQSVIDEVWYPHINHGRISLAIDYNSSAVVGLACLEPIEKTSVEEFEHSEKIFEYLNKIGLFRSGLSVWYFSELAVVADYRNSKDHIGTELINLALRDLRSRSDNGLFGHDDKMFVLTRTDVDRSMSINAFKRGGFTFLEEVIQHAEDSAQIVKHDGKSIEKIWGYKVVHPIDSW